MSAPPEAEYAAIPGDLVIRLWHRGLPSMGAAELTVFHARDLIAGPAAVTGFYDGGTGYAAWPEPPFILFDFSLTGIDAGRVWVETGAMAARIGALLASNDAGWPGTQAHARCLPVTDFRLMYRVTPGRVADGDDGSARVRALLAQMTWLDGAVGLLAASLTLDRATA